MNRSLQKRKTHWLEQYNIWTYPSSLILVFPVPHPLWYSSRPKQKQSYMIPRYGAFPLYRRRRMCIPEQPEGRFQNNMSHEANLASEQLFQPPLWGSVLVTCWCPSCNITMESIRPKSETAASIPQHHPRRTQCGNDRTGV